jgi:hypothetical protein
MPFDRAGDRNPPTPIVHPARKPRRSPPGVFLFCGCPGLGLGNREARADCQGGELIDRGAAGAPIGKLFFVELRGHMRQPFAGYRITAPGSSSLQSMRIVQRKRRPTSNGGRIATIGEDAAPSLSNRVPILDIGGDLVLPDLVDGHMRLDKTLIGLPWMPHMAGPTRMSRIETDKRVLPHLPVSTEERTGNLIEARVARGTARLRTHVDIYLESRRTKLDGVPAAREAPRRQYMIGREADPYRDAPALPLVSSAAV